MTNPISDVNELLIDEEFDFEDEGEFDVRVRMSTLSDDEVLVFDNCGRFVPVFKDDIENLIEQLEEYVGFFSIRDDRVRINPSDLIQLSNDMQSKVSPEVDEPVVTTTSSAFRPVKDEDFNYYDESIDDEEE